MKILISLISSIPKINNSVEQSPSRDANSSSASQIFPALNGIQKFFTTFTIARHEFRDRMKCFVTPYFFTMRKC